MLSEFIYFLLKIKLEIYDFELYSRKRIKESIYAFKKLKNIFFYFKIGVSRRGTHFQEAFKKCSTLRHKQKYRNTVFIDYFNRKCNYYRNRYYIVVVHRQHLYCFIIIIFTSKKEKKYSRGHISATWSQILDVYNSDAEITSFFFQ